MLKGFRAYVIFIAVALLYPSILYVFIIPSHTSDAILVVGDFSPDDFGEQVRDGIENAHLSTDPANQLVVRTADIHNALQNPEPYRTREIRHAIFRELGDGPVLAIVAATTSAFSGTVIDTSHALQIPVILTVATTDSLLLDQGGVPKDQDTSEAQSTEDISGVIRLPPNDTNQAITISTWIINHLKSSSRKANINKERRVLIAYDNSVYGTFLFGQISSRLSASDVTIIGWKITPYGRSYDLLENAKRTKASLLVHIGYYQDAKELVENAQSLRFEKPILLSDGAFSPKMKSWKANRSLVYVSSPADPVATKRTELRGFSVYGHDAYVLLNRARNSSTALLPDKGATVIDKIKRMTYVLPSGENVGRNRWLGDYRYEGGSGENIAATFHIIKLDQAFDFQNEALN